MSARLLEHYAPPGGPDDGWRAEERLLATWARGHGASETLATVVAWLVRAESAGDSCLALDAPQRFGSPGWDAATIEALRAQSLVSDGTTAAPLVLDSRHRVYWWRNWRHEQVIASVLGQRLMSRSSAAAQPRESDRVPTPSMANPDPVPDATIDALFAGSDAAHDAAQREAVRRAGRRLVILTGGPGTGKTRTALRLLLAASVGASRSLRVALAAPTGKAAQRLNEALGEGLTELRQSTTPGFTDATRTAIEGLLAEPARTVHRLLGYSPTSRRFRHGRQQPLDADLVLVDEASMLDLGILRALCEALPAHASLVLMGDAEQLGSVSTGSVFDDIVQALEGADDSPVVRLSHGFRSGAALAPVLDAARRGDADALLDGCDGAHAARHPLPDRHALALRVQSWSDAMVEHIVPLARGRGADGARELIAGWRRRQLLCALREGDFGANAQAARVDAALAAALGVPADRPDFAGRSILIRNNDYGRDLFNGDLGVLLPDDAGRLRAWFPGQGDEDAMRSFVVEDLPAHTSASALTVHKSQGSEYAHVALVLPPAGGLALFDRRLVYTALSRARERVELWCEEPILREALARRSGRIGGLRDKLLAELRPRDTASFPPSDLDA